MQQIGVNGQLHFPEDCVLLADKIYPNRHSTVMLFTTQQINRKPEHMRDSSIFIRLMGRCAFVLPSSKYKMYLFAQQLNL